MKSLSLVCFVSTIGFSSIISVESSNLIQELFSNVSNDVVNGDDLQTQGSSYDYDALAREGKRRKYSSRKQDRSDYGYGDDQYGYEDDHYGHYDHYDTNIVHKDNDINTQSILIGSIMALGLGGLAALYNYGLQDQIAQKATSASVCRTIRQVGRLNLKKQTTNNGGDPVPVGDYNDIIGALNSIESPQCRH